MASRSWLDIMAEDSNISMASITSITSITSNDQILTTTSSKTKDPEFDNSKQGVNLLFNKNVQIICDDSQSRKRTFKEMESQQTEHQQIESNKENHKFLPPKAKQRTNVNGDWKKRKNENKIGFGRFLNWANNDKSNNKLNNNDDNKNKKILRNKINDNERNICHINKNGNNGSNSNSKLIICASSINQNRGRRRKQIRARRNNKKNNNISNTNHQNDENMDKQNMTKIIEEREEDIIIDVDHDNDDDDDIDVDVEIIDTQSVEKVNDDDTNNKEKEDEEKNEIKTKEIEKEKQEIKDDEKQKESEEDNDDIDDDDGDDQEEEEDDDLKINKSVPILNKTKQRRITPTLENVVFDTNLILNKVPILKKKLNNETLDGPIFLNADQYEKLNVKSPNIDQHKEKEKEEEQEQEQDEEEEDYDCDVWGRNSLINDNKINNKSQSWANKLFGSKIKENKKLKQRQEEILINQRKEERKHEMKIESLLPTSKSIMFSRESSLSINTDNSSSISTPNTTITTTTTTTTICKPSSEATEWREKQILIGKNTIGYKNFNKKYPNKELKFRTSNNLLSTPDSKDKVGKKRWVGKYQKWRKFLHSFDCEIDENNENNDINDDIDI